MALSKDDAIKRARQDLASRLGISDDQIKEESVERADFPDMALGAPIDDEMSGQMITSGWRLRLKAGGKGTYEYRASSDGLRLYNFKGENYRI